MNIEQPRNMLEGRIEQRDLSYVSTLLISAQLTKRTEIKDSLGITVDVEYSAFDIKGLVDHLEAMSHAAESNEGDSEMNMVVAIFARRLIQRCNDLNCDIDFYIKHLLGFFVVVGYVLFQDMENDDGQIEQGYTMNREKLDEKYVEFISKKIQLN